MTHPPCPELENTNTPTERERERDFFAPLWKSRTFRTGCHGIVTRVVQSDPRRDGTPQRFCNVCGSCWNDLSNDVKRRSSPLAFLGSKPLKRGICGRPVLAQTGRQRVCNACSRRDTAARSSRDGCIDHGSTPQEDFVDFFCSVTVAFTFPEKCRYTFACWRPLCPFAHTCEKSAGTQVGRDLDASCRGVRDERGAAQAAHI